MKNVPRMMDYERVIGFESALGEREMPLVGHPIDKHVFNGSVSNLVHLIESSFDWSGHCPGKVNAMRYDIPVPSADHLKNTFMSETKLTKKGTAVIDDYETVPVYISMSHLPKGYCENKYVQSYMFQVGARMFFDMAKEMETPMLKKVMEMSRKDRGDIYMDKYNDIINQLNNRFVHLYHLWKFQREEQNFFVLEDQNLIDALANTEYDCRTHWLRSPNDSIYIMLPKNDHNLEGMYVNLENAIEGNKYLRIYMPRRSDKKDRKMHPMGYGSFYWSNNIKKDINLQASIRAGIAESVAVEDGVERNKEEMLEIKDVMTYYSNLAAQAMLYITSENREAVLNRVPKKTVSVNRKKKFISREKTQSDYWALGGNDTLYIGKPKRVNPKDGTLIVNKGTGKKLDHLTLVPAHFHGYWRKRPSKIAELKEYQIIEEKYDDMGKRMVLYKKWLKPYYKGRGELVVKEYKLTTGGYEKEYIEEEVDSE